MAGHGGGGRDQADAAALGVEISRCARFAQVAPAAGVRDARRVEIAAGADNAFFAVIVGVVVGGRDKIYAEPFQVVEQVRLGGHVSAAADILVSFEVAMHAGFEVGEGGVGAETDISQLQVALFVKHRQAPRRHDVAQKHQRKFTAFGIVKHLEPLSEIVDRWWREAIL